MVAHWVHCQEVSQKAGRYLATNPFTTCFVLMGSGALVGVIVTLLYHCCCVRFVPLVHV